MFPRFMFHKERAHDGQLFRTAEELAAAGAGWVDTPQAFDPAYTAPEPLVAEGSIPADAAAAGYVPQRYPTTVFKRGEPDSAQVVVDAEAHAALERSAPGVWNESPDPHHKCWDDAPAEDLPPADAGGTSPALMGALSPDQVAEFQKARASDIIAKLDSVDDPAVLAALKGAEAANPSGVRSTVIKAIVAREKALSAPVA